MSCPCWYLVNLPRPAASVSQTEGPHTWVLVSRDQPREPRAPHRARGGRQAGQRRAKQKHNLASPRQTAHLLSASIWGTAHRPSIHILMTANTEQHTHTHTHTHTRAHTHTRVAGFIQQNVTWQTCNKTKKCLVLV